MLLKSAARLPFATLQRHWCKKKTLWLDPFRHRRHASFLPSFLHDSHVADFLLLASAASAMHFRWKFASTAADLKREQLQLQKEQKERAEINDKLQKEQQDRAEIKGKYKNQCSENERLKEKLDTINLKRMQPSQLKLEGEACLESCLERAKSEELVHSYDLQKVLKPSGKIPDAVVALPNDRLLIVDSKAPKWEKLETEEDRIKYKENLKNTIKILSNKRYADEVQNSYNVVWMLLPDEAYLNRLRSDGSNHDTDIHNFADANDVKVVGPESFLSDLRMLKISQAEVTELIKQKELGDPGKLLGPKWDTTMKGFISMGRQLEKTSKQCNSTLDSLMDFDKHAREQLKQPPMAGRKPKEIQFMPKAVPDENP